MRMILLILLSCISLFCSKNADETTVTTANVNVRSGPGINYEVLATLPSKTEVSPTQISKDGWRQVKYHGDVAWISSNYLSNQTTATGNTQRIEETEYENVISYEDLSPENTDELFRTYENYGTEGRLIIPELGINVALNYADSSDAAQTQSVTDWEDSASYSYRQGTIVIADHKNQGFSGLYNAYVGLKGYILHEDGSITTLVCERKTDHGSNNEIDLYDEYGELASSSPQPIYTYTCNPAGWWDITIVYWNYA